MEKTGLLEQVSQLSDLFAESVDFKESLSQALDFLLELLHTHGQSTPHGAVLIAQEASESVPWLVVSHQFPEDWLEPNHQSFNQLTNLAVQALHRATPTQSELDGNIITALPFMARSSQIGLVGQGTLIFTGTTGDLPALVAQTDPLCQVIGRSIFAERLKQSRQFQGQELAAMQMIIQTLSTNPDAEDLQAAITKGVSQILDAEHTFLVTLDEEHVQAMIKKTLGENQDWIYQANPTRQSGLVTECLRTRRPLIVNNVSEHPLYNPNTDALDGVIARSFLCAPLTMNDQIQGVVVVLNKRSGGFDTFDQKLLATMATMIAYSINSINLVRQLKVTNADLQASRWELLRSRNILRALFDNIPLSFYIVDRKYYLLAINIARSERTGKEPNVLVGRHCYTALYGRSDPCPECQVSRTLYGGEYTFRIARTWDENNEPMEWEINSYPIIDETGQSVQAIMLEEDVTEKRRLENKLIQSEKLAAVGQLAAGLAHEINNPLTAVIANAQLLQRLPELDEEVREAIDLIALAGNRAGQVVRNLLDLSRKDVYEFRSVDIDENIHKALNLLQYELVSRDIRVDVDEEPGLPRVLASPDHLEGVWINLIVNAIDALSERPGEKVISIHSVRQGREVQVSISDNGTGIPPERIDRIFEPFYTTKAAGHGTGLGLAVCQRTIKEHGGHIRVDSRMGEGTSFTVVLPASGPIIASSPRGG